MPLPPASQLALPLSFPLPLLQAEKTLLAQRRDLELALQQKQADISTLAAELAAFQAAAVQVSEMWCSKLHVWSILGRRERVQVKCAYAAEADERARWMQTKVQIVSLGPKIVVF